MAVNEISYDAPRPEAVHDLNQTLLAQQQAGPVATEQLARDFLARVQRDIDEQVDMRVRQLVAAGQLPAPSAKQQKRQQDHAKEMLLGSLGIGVPLTLFAGAFGHLPGIIAVWVGLVLINIAWSRSTFGG
jgi:hypothetical protein